MDFENIELIDADETVDTEFSGWTFSELGAAAHTLMHDLRGSWAWEYVERMEQLRDILEAMIAYKGDGKDGFIESLSGDLLEFKQWAKDDLAVTLEELGDPCDGRTFRDGCHFYEVEFNNGRTKRVANYLSGWVECDHWHWFQETHSGEQW